MNLIVEDTTHFQSEARLLEELGERLVASADVAIVELIKNAYDADATECKVELKRTEEVLIVSDDGHGMTEKDFLNKWMHIATDSKKRERISKIFNRKLTGAKGIGRFATRFLSSELLIESVAYDEQRKQNTKIIARFNWNEFTKNRDIGTIPIIYKLYDMPRNASLGTVLRLNNLRRINTNEYVFNKDVRTEVLKIISPLEGLESGRFDTKKSKFKEDTGFNVIFVKEKSSKNEKDEKIVQNVLKNYWFRLTIDLNGSKLKYKIFAPGNNSPIFDHSQQYKNHIRQGLFADIRYFPRRKGMFADKEINGVKAWQWIANNVIGGAVVDHGFRIKPYGFGEDDWLKISQDKAINRRDWRSAIMDRYYPMPDEIRKDTSQNYMLYLPRRHQLIGAVYVESDTYPNKKSETDLIPAMDRQGFLENDAFYELFEIVRTGLEMIALTDKKKQMKLEEEKAKIVSDKASYDIKKAIQHISSIPTLSSSDKNRLIAQYSYLAENINELDEYNRSARQNLETMSLLGVIAGFMTHESNKILGNIGEIIEIVSKLSRKYKEVKEPLAKIKGHYAEYLGYLDYTTTFINAIHSNSEYSFKVLPQIERIINRLKTIAGKYSIEVDIKVKKNLETMSAPVELYSGVILNLYVNSMKAVIAGTKGGECSRILFKAWNEPKKHILEISDNGIGIPPSLQKRIWDPLFTTTSNMNNPLGSGMGIGLSMIKKLLKGINGNIRLVEPIKGYSTCFRVEYSTRRIKHEKKESINI